jgi:hypothetical protein
VSFDIRPLCSQREDLGAQQIGGWVDTRASLGFAEKSPTELSWLLEKQKQMVETSGKK